MSPTNFLKKLPTMIHSKSRAYLNPVYPDWPCLPVARRIVQRQPSILWSQLSPSSPSRRRLVVRP